MSDENASPETSAGRPKEYVVVARRYRPKAFEELIGQEHVARALGSAITNQRVGHAYLFTGARGVGKTSAARILAKALNCVTGPTPTPCNACDVCQSVSRGDDVDVLEIDGASNRGIDEIRQLRQNAGVRPSRARFKVYIIDEVHMLTKDAFNALLKTLEEPPEHVKFIFATTEPNKIPITILSRCQRFDFAGIDALKIEERLRQIAEAEGIHADAEALQILARRAGGSMRDSQSLLEQLLSLGKHELTAEDVNSMLGTAPAARVSRLVRALADRNAGTALAELDAAVRSGVEVGQLLDQLLGYYRDVMTAAVGCSSDTFLNVTPSQHEEIANLARELGVATILAVVGILEQASSRLRGSLHGRTLVEVALVRIANLEELDNLGDLIEAVRSGAVAEPPARVAPAAPASAGSLARETAAAAQHARQTAEPSKKNGTPPEVVTHEAVTHETAEPPAVEAQLEMPTFGPLTAESAAALWNHVLSHLEEGLVKDYASSTASVALAGPNRMVANFARTYNFNKQMCERPEQKLILERALTAATGGTPVRLEFGLLPETAAPASAPAVSRSAQRRKQEAEVRTRPIVKRAMELFDVEQPEVILPDQGN